MMKNIFKIAATLSLVALASNFTDGWAQASVGAEGRAGLYTDNSDFHIGAGLRIGMPVVTIVPNAEYVFVDGGKFYTLNLDGQINVLTLPLTSLWLGGGLAWLNYDPDNSDSFSDTGANLFAGFGLNAIVLKPYLQAKYIITDSDQFVLSVGLRF